ncbi:MAG: M48 family metallopeptidase [Chlamydiales bacterium]|nr:M48 family metallopeptidase [Chlamydiales bacterium]
MAMNFWEAQRRAKSWTKVYLVAFIVMTFVVAVGAEILVRQWAGPDYQESFPIVASVFLVVTFGTALYQWSCYSAFGGSYVAESLGGRLALPESPDMKERQLLNIVEEVAVASALPVPPVYIIDAQQINAFAAGLTQDKAAIAVTRGALELLNRDELQGVIAHEFGHVANGDMRMSMHLSAMLMGFFIILYLAFRMMSMTSMRRDSNEKGGNPIMVAALVLMIAGAVTWLFGSILRAMVSREREYLADATSVQFTRNPAGLANALRKIEAEHGKVSDMPKEGMAFSHMYFDHPSFLGGIFATHPPVEKRIAAIEGREG